ncbi:hypothetical protein MMC28_004666 [Mycoblastus sanguinarius]|nr:hypothetical protein [Mycoblastus sanguinarius]
MSLNIAEDLFEPTSVPVLRPSVPEPTASSATVNNFIVQFLLSQDWELTRDEAQVKAKRIKVDGKSLYDIPEKEWIDKFGTEGRSIFHALQTSKYGYDGGYWPQLKAAGAVFFFLGFFNGGWQLWNERNPRDYQISITFTVISAVLVIFNQSCKSAWLVDSTWFPERLKIREGNAPKRPWGWWTSTR